MTFIVAITCKDGVVFASDGQSTRVVDGDTIKEKVPKIFKLGKNRVWGGAGNEEGVFRFMNYVDTFTDQKESLTEDRLKTYLEKFALEVKTEAETQREKMGAMAPGLQCPEYLVIGHQENPMIWCMYSDCTLIFYDKENFDTYKSNLFSIGAGQTVPRAYFDSIKDRNREYTLSQGSLIAYRLVREAINSSPYVGEPIDIWTVANSEVKQNSEAALEKLEILCDTWVDWERLIADAIMSYFD
jgi:20S proteasome alpha/beta subunit